MIIEVEPTLLGSIIIDKELMHYQKNQILKELVAINEMMAGLLCAEDLKLPEITTEYTDGRWIIKISCCCVPLMDKVEQRLDEHYKG